MIFFKQNYDGNGEKKIGDRKTGMLKIKHLICNILCRLKVHFGSLGVSLGYCGKKARQFSIPFYDHTSAVAGLVTRILLTRVFLNGSVNWMITTQSKSTYILSNRDRLNNSIKKNMSCIIWFILSGSLGRLPRETVLQTFFISILTFPNSS